jgi:carboxylesterase type B
LEPCEIISIFEDGQHSGWGPKLRKLYHIAPDRPTPSTSGALDFVNDARFAVPAETIAEKVAARGNKVYRYVVDETNPWQSSARAHHAVDLIFLFGTLDLSHNPGAEAVGQEMRNRWISFVNGEEPWSPVSTGKRFAFGPYGESKEIDEKQFAARRRVAHMDVLRKAGFAAYGPIMNKLTAGRISLLN